MKKGNESFLGGVGKERRWKESVFASLAWVHHFDSPERPRKILSYLILFIPGAFLKATHLPLDFALASKTVLGGKKMEKGGQKSESCCLCTTQKREREREKKEERGRRH